ncbi:DUF6673 family protein [Ethanoligenens harbinense]|uniref:DUF6673 domain-containing protein n=1 Tax=Ethanoligenens harbinense (strain DSM 18485 / JCM 12961 / CGMCC 1.5033 / YUAN-3) TaxID=663278 RepID=E6U611_ETHHY|nr:DUF6673 family protein [Ethanoligenens harbinense]ADU25690.1 hypothetical protein Ethha_0100 [Ethanoligenens harbinense YUAN-3]AVQ94865.1 hypothetical protein CXQ68_00510 [Ethanoligenens harbinense YUAN-3]AYF37556.1 hypothetical protein CXP51_00515 [Ethanoligenens harbinense]AYF40276.1 hypothetical protein CN246_00510 [Ethanoligenens harbinense]QCN91111.1 hypothetical protein DRA42_00520 [Ethanoligenens harbinense]
MEINGVTLDLDLDDMDKAEQVQKVIEGMQSKIEQVKETDDYVTGGRKVCRIVNDCFNQIFGTGTSEKIFEGMKLTPHIDAFVALGDAIKEQKEQQNAHMQSVCHKYSPNRTERRARKK